MAYKSSLLCMIAGLALTLSPFTSYAQTTPSTRLVGISGKVYSLLPEEADAIEFLYKSMPMSDRLMKDTDYFIRNVRVSLLARKELSWGETVPDDIWRHFVLPVRSNNENLDNFRTIYYNELRDRVKGMSMHDAALEINHWLHEKVTYEPSDGRTSSPMSTIRTAKGRCGEESVLGVAAFRAVGIPARQVYTPRWAHTDDNHAWVEVWVDGKWHFLGACEPEPELDRAWFNAPASRGMLMHTKVFGNYPGPEQIISVREGITEINVTDNYVKTRDAVVTVVNKNGKVMPGIKVMYKIYNYAEFYTAATMATDAQGKTMLKTGIGNMLAWASDGKYFGFALISSPSTRIVLDHKIGEVFSMDLDVVPPVESPIPSHVTEAQIAENTRRFEAENAQRAAYEQTFFGERFCTHEIDDLHPYMTLDQLSAADTYLRKAKGNWQAIYDFLISTPKERLPEALALLGAISDKDLRDTPARILINTLNSTVSRPDCAEYVDYLLNPRISNELLTDYRLTLRLPGSDKQPMTASQIVDYISKNIKINDAANAYHVPITPTEVWKGREADTHSRDIFFVALCRNNGIPARIEPITGECQYHDGKKWITVDFKAASMISPATGILTGVYEPTKYLPDPEYYRHFTVSAMNTGAPRLLEFGEDMGEKYSTVLKGTGSELPEGYYMLTSGVRQANGSVSVHLEFFNIKAGDTTSVPLVMRHTPGAIEVIGAIDAEKKYLPAGATEETSLLSTTGRGYFLLAILGATDEPSNHAAQELLALRNTLQSWGRPVMIIGQGREQQLADLPYVHFGTDPSGAVMKMITEAVSRNSDGNSRLPLIIVADSFGRVVFESHGYDTSLAQKLQSILPQL